MDDIHLLFICTYIAQFILTTLPECMNKNVVYTQTVLRIRIVDCDFLDLWIRIVI